jgi:hypothetical protein
VTGPARQVAVVETIDGGRLPVGIHGGLVTVGGALRFTKTQRTQLLAALLEADRAADDPDWWVWD